MGVDDFFERRDTLERESCIVMKFDFFVGERG
jgi:hypothetical protein